MSLLFWSISGLPHTQDKLGQIKILKIYTGLPHTQHTQDILKFLNIMGQLRIVLFYKILKIVLRLTKNLMTVLLMILNNLVSLFCHFKSNLLKNLIFVNFKMLNFFLRVLKKAQVDSGQFKVTENNFLTKKIATLY